MGSLRRYGLRIYLRSRQSNRQGVCLPRQTPCCSVLHWHVLQCVAVRCSVILEVIYIFCTCVVFFGVCECCSVLQCAAVSYVAVCCSMLPCVAGRVRQCVCLVTLLVFIHIFIAACRVLQCRVLQCRVLQCAAVCCSVVCCNVLQCVAICCSVVCCSVLQCRVSHSFVLQCVAVCGSVLQRVANVAVCCSVLQCRVLQCRVLQCAAESTSSNSLSSSISSSPLAGATSSPSLYHTIHTCIMPQNVLYSRRGLISASSPF